MQQQKNIGEKLVVNKLKKIKQQNRHAQNVVMAEK